jgi:hypothetical protein
MNHRGIWLTATILAVIVLMAQIAGASTRDGIAPTTASASVSADLTSAVATVSLPEQASAVAEEKSANGLATANESITSRATTSATNNVRVNGPASAPQDNTTGARPGWGCGDTNHTHSGPPGRPGATPPPNCKP